MFEAVTLVGSYTGARMSKLKLDDSQSKAVYPKDVRYLTVVDELLALSAMPVSAMSGIVLKKHDGRMNTRLLTFADVVPTSGILRIYETLQLSTPDLIPTLVHEAAHFTDLYGGDVSGYKSVEARDILREKTYVFLAQCIESGLFINEYHESVYNKLASCEKGSVAYRESYKYLLNETRAILMESVFENSSQLNALARDQYTILQQKGFDVKKLINPHRLGLLCFATLKNFSDDVQVLQHELSQRKRMMEELVVRNIWNNPKKVYLQ